MATNSNETAQFMATKAALMTTTQTPGWRCIQQLAGRIIEVAKSEAVKNADDDIKGILFLRKAKVAEEVFRELFSAIETAKDFGTESEPEWFAQLQAFEDAGVEV